LRLSSVLLIEIFDLRAENVVKKSSWIITKSHNKVIWVCRTCVRRLEIEVTNHLRRGNVGPMGQFWHFCFFWKTDWYIQSQVMLF